MCGNFWLHKALEHQIITANHAAGSCWHQGYCYTLLGPENILHYTITDAENIRFKADAAAMAHENTLPSERYQQRYILKLHQTNPVIILAAAAGSLVHGNNLQRN